MQNSLYENEFDLHPNELVRKTDFHMIKVSHLDSF